MKFLILISLPLILFSCNDSEQKVIDISERTPQSKRDYNAPDTLEIIDSNTAQLAHFQNFLPEVESIRLLERKSFFQRFRPDNAEKFVLYLKNGDSLEYERMVFSDSLITRSAFFNWMDRADISYYGAPENIQRDPFALMITDTLIMRLSGAIDFKFWESYFEENELMDEGDNWIKQRKYGKAQWFVLKDDKLTNLTTDQ